MFVAVQQQNLQTPIVFGFGTTEQAAFDDAANSAETLDDIVVYPCTPELAAAVERGIVVCQVENGVASIQQ